MSAPRQQLATILILSAIDVLLCSFTAALTLFFIGAGADAANAQLQEESAVVADTENRGIGAPAAIVIAMYSADSPKLKPAAASGYSTLPAESWQSANPVSWLIEVQPTDRNPFVLTRDSQSGTLAVQLSISGAASPVEFRLICRTDRATKVSIGEGNVTTDDPACEVMRQ